MADTVASLASLLKLGPGLPAQPPRFAKVTAISGDTVTVSLGNGTADAVRCCDCAVGNVVLLETMPSGILAAVGVKGYSGGSYTLPPATTTTLGGVIADGSSITVDLDGTIHAVGLTCTVNTGGVPWSSATAFPATTIGWEEHVWSDGRLTRWVWQAFYYSSSARSVTFGPFATVTEFTATPLVGLDALWAGKDTTAQVSARSYSCTSGSESIGAYITYTGATNANMLFALKLEGRWQ